jgi:hypothetical protein
MIVFVANTLLSHGETSPLAINCPFFMPLLHISGL